MSEKYRIHISIRELILSGALQNVTILTELLVAQFCSCQEGASNINTIYVSVTLIIFPASPRYSPFRSEHIQ